MGAKYNSGSVSSGLTIEAGDNNNVDENPGPGKVRFKSP
jgi:hypothetical protein